MPFLILIPILLLLVGDLIRKRMAADLDQHWEDAGQGWEGLEDTLTLAGWSRTRRVVVLLRALTGEMLITRQRGSPK